MKNLLVCLFALVGASWVGHASAQSSESFVRTGRALSAEFQSLSRKQIDLKLRSSALTQETQTLKGKLDEINAMPAGVGKDAAIQGYKRRVAAWHSKYDDFRAETERFSNDVRDFNRRTAEYKRRLKAANAANRFQVGESVSVEWKGRWWSATVLRAENGSYYVTYPGWSSVWDEWVGPSRIRSR